MDAYVLQYTTDTAHPQNLVPIYFIHSMSAPLCDRPGCWCQVHKVRIIQLLIGVALHDLRLEDATPLIRGDTD